jgi:ferredoxin-NADP reductase
MLALNIYIKWQEYRNKPFDPPRFTPFTIVDREEVSPTSIILTLQPEARGPLASWVRKPDPYKEAWEKGTWSVEVKQPQLQIARAYTPLPPREGDPDENLRFLIRKEYKGEVSKYIHDLPVGKRVELRGPNIEFALPSEVTDVIFLAGGTGIAPGLQIVHTLLERRKGQLPPMIHIVWANRRREDCKGGYSSRSASMDAQTGYIVREIQRLQNKYPGNLQVDYLVDEEGTFLDQNKLAPLVKTYSEVKFGPVHTRIDSKLLFVSGPEGFVGYLAGPKRWEGGKEGQGDLGGLLRRMGIRDWKVWKL